MYDVAHCGFDFAVIYHVAGFGEGIQITVHNLIICLVIVLITVMDTYSMCKHTKFEDGDRPIIYALYCSTCATDFRSCSKSTYLHVF